MTESTIVRQVGTSSIIWRGLLCTRTRKEFVFQEEL